MRALKKVAVIQSNYVPWVGYFAIMAEVDLFVVYECVQYTKNDWRNRNQIQSPDGCFKWLTIPVRQYSSTQPFMETRVSSSAWALSHLKTLNHYFSHTKGWNKWSNELELLYKTAQKMTHLFEINRLFLDWVINKLHLTAQVVYLDSYPEFSNRNERLISILHHFDATHYLSGPSAKDYIDVEKFEIAKINLEFVDYDQIIMERLIGPKPIKTTSIMQLMLEDRHEFKSH